MLAVVRRCRSPSLALTALGVVPCFMLRQRHVFTSPLCRQDQENNAKQLSIRVRVWRRCSSYWTWWSSLEIALASKTSHHCFMARAVHARSRVLVSALPIDARRKLEDEPRMVIVFYPQKPIGLFVAACGARRGDSSSNSKPKWATTCSTVHPLNKPSARRASAEPFQRDCRKQRQQGGRSNTISNCRNELFSSGSSRVQW